MPVAGLPAAVETTLNALLTENVVTSWKVAGEGDGAVVVLRLKSSQANTMSTNMATSTASSRQPSVKCFRRKPPSQLRRDQERAQQRKANQNQASPSHEHSDEQTFSLKVPVANTSETVVRPTLESIVERIVGLDSMPTIEKNTQASYCPQNRPQHATRFSQSKPTTEQIQPEVYKSMEATVVRDYMSTISDDVIKQNLQNPRRNKRFRNVRANETNDILLCESDDLVVEFDCRKRGGEGKWSYFFVKQDSVSLLPEERTRMYQLQLWRKVEQGEFRVAIARATDDLCRLHGMCQASLPNT